MLKKKKNTLREIVVGEIMRMVKGQGIYTEEHIYVRTSAQKENILIDNRR